jgi:hypothetical protein
LARKQSAALRSRPFAREAEDAAAEPDADDPFTDIDDMEGAKPGMNPGLKVVLGVGIGAGVMLLAGAIIVAAAGY